MNHNKIVRAIEKQRIAVFLADKDKSAPGVSVEVWKTLELLRESIMASEKFFLDAHGISGEEVNASARAMSEMDLFRLPHKMCFTETFFAFAGPQNKFMKGRCSIITSEMPEISKERYPDCCFISEVVVNLPAVDGKHGFRFSPGWFAHGLREEDAQFVPLAGPAGQIELIPGGLEVCQKTAGVCSHSIATLIVLLETKGAEKEFVPTEKINLISRDQPVNGYTIVRNYRSRDSSGRQIEERKRVRLHLRRGHVRTQHWGRNNKYTKKIWIEPTLVGYEEEGKIEHLYEVDKA
jgi:hypothetical protein